MNSNLVLVLVQYRFHSLGWSYFVVILVAYEKTGRLTGKKPNNFNRLAGPPELLLNLPKIKNRKAPEGTALGHTGSAGPYRAKALSGWRANASFERSQGGRGHQRLLVNLPTPRKQKGGSLGGARRNESLSRKIHTQNTQNSNEELRPAELTQGSIKKTGGRNEGIRRGWLTNAYNNSQLRDLQLTPGSSNLTPGSSLASSLATEPVSRVRVRLVLVLRITIPLMEANQ